MKTVDAVAVVDAEESVSVQETSEDADEPAPVLGTEVDVAAAAAAAAGIVDATLLAASVLEWLKLASPFLALGS